MLRHLLSIAGAMLLLPAAASAQGRFEITPTFSYNFGGTIDAEDSVLFDFDLEANDSEAFGITFDIPIASWAQIELLASRQATELNFDRGIFQGSEGIADFDVSYYHVGGLFSFGTGQIHPFFVISLGVAELEPDVPGASAETKFSGSIGGGVKIFFNQHFGIRLEGRGFWTVLDSYDDYYDYDCGCGYSNEFTQGQASAGVIFAF